MILRNLCSIHAAHGLTILMAQGSFPHRAVPLRSPDAAALADAVQAQQPLTVHDLTGHPVSVRTDVQNTHSPLAQTEVIWAGPFGQQETLLSVERFGQQTDLLAAILRQPEHQSGPLSVRTWQGGLLIYAGSTSLLSDVPLGILVHALERADDPTRMTHGLQSVCTLSGDYASHAVALPYRILGGGEAGTLLMTEADLRRAVQPAFPPPTAAHW